MAVRDIDRGMKKIMRELKIANGSHTKVGHIQGTIRRGSGKGGSSDQVRIAAIHEFGAPKANIKPRPAHKQAIDLNRKKIYNFQDRMYIKILEGMTARRGIGLIGEFVTGRIKAQYTKLRSPGLKNPSKKRGGASANPLVDTGQLRNSVTHVEKF